MEEEEGKWGVKEGVAKGEEVVYSENRIHLKKEHCRSYHHFQLLPDFEADLTSYP